jgi:uncharacterized protein
MVAGLARGSLCFDVVGLTAFQCRLEYFPDRRLTEVTRTGITTADGGTLVGIFRQRTGGPLILYFHGNGRALVDRVPRFRMFTARGYPLLVVSYRGYGGSRGSPPQSGLMQDGEAAYRAVRARGYYYGDRIVLMGASFGTGVAIVLAPARVCGPQ